MIAQLPLFAPKRAAWRSIDVPPVLAEVFAREDAALFVSISGGKDGQAMLSALVRLHREQGWRCGIFAIHADLGRAEWAESLPHCERICADAGVPLTVVRRPQGDLVQEIEDRMEKLTGEDRSPWPSATQRYCTADQKRDQLAKAKRVFWPDAQNRYCTADQKRTQIDKALRAPMWPDAANRYCTSHQKTNQIDKELRAYRLVVSAIGLRAEESSARSRKLAFTLDRDLTSKPLLGVGQQDLLGVWKSLSRKRRRLRRQGRKPNDLRLAFDWLPVLDWSLAEVFEECGTSVADRDRRRALYRDGRVEEALGGWPCHVAYVYGNDRVSCVFCILASQNDLRVGAIHNPELYRHYVRLERRTGFTFQHKKALADVAPELLEVGA